MGELADLIWYLFGIGKIIDVHGYCGLGIDVDVHGRYGLGVDAEPENRITLRTSRSQEK